MHDWPPYAPSDTTFYMRAGGSLSETAPAGSPSSEQYMAITEGVIGLRFRNPSGPAEGTLLTPGEVVEIDLVLWPTSIVFNSGHRLQIDITSSSDPKFEANPNTGDGFRANTETRVATITILHDQDHPSSITLPTP